MQFPFADLRRVWPNVPRLVPEPYWRKPSSRAFLRSLGPLRDWKYDNPRRNRVPLARQADKPERYFVDATNHFEYQRRLSIAPFQSLPLKLLAARIMSDGFLSARIEFVWNVVFSEERKMDVSTAEQVVTSLLDLPIVYKYRQRRRQIVQSAPAKSKILFRRGKVREFKFRLIEVSSHFPKQYQRWTECHSGTQPDVEAVRPLDIIISCVLSPKQNMPWASQSRYEMISRSIGTKIVNWPVRRRGRHVNCWFFGDYSNDSLPRIASFRRAHLRLAAQLQSLWAAVAAMQPGGPLQNLSGIQQDFFASGLEGFVESVADTAAVGQFASQENAEASEDDPEWMARGLLSRDVQCIMREVKRFLPPKRQAALQLAIKDSVVQMAVGQNMRNDLRRQQGIFAETINARDITLNQTWNERHSDEDLPKLADELRRLREAAKEEAKTAEHDIELGAVAQAEKKVGEGDRNAAFAALAQAGTWTLGIAEKIGVPILHALLKRAILGSGS